MPSTPTPLTRNSQRNGNTVGMEGRAICLKRVVFRPRVLGSANETQNAKTQKTLKSPARLQQPTDLRKLTHSQLAQLALGPKTKQDEQIVEKLIQEHALDTRQKEMAERLGPGMENLVKEATGFSILKLLSEHGICSSIDTLESNQTNRPTDVVVEDETETNTRTESEQHLIPVTMVKMEPVETTFVEQTSEFDPFPHDMVPPTAKLLELDIRNEEIQGQLQVVDRQIAKCIDLKLFLLRKQEILNAERRWLLSAPPPQLPLFPNPPLPLLPPLPTPVPNLAHPPLPRSPQSANCQTLAATENIRMLSQVKTELKDEIFLISDESDVEMTSELSKGKQKENNESVKTEVPTAVIADLTIDRDASTHKGRHPEEEPSNSSPIPPMPSISISAPQMATVRLAKSAQYVTAPKNRAPPTFLTPSNRGEAEEPKKKRKKKLVTCPRDYELKTRPTSLFVNPKSIRQFRFPSHVDGVTILRGCPDGVWTCSKDGTAMGFEVISSPKGKLITRCIRIYRHNCRQVCGMEMLNGKSGSSIILANANGVLQKFEMSTSHKKKAITVKVNVIGVTCTALRWNTLIIGTVNGQVINYNATTLEFITLYHSSPSGITCLGTGMEGACRIVCVGSMETDISVRDAFSGLLIRFIKLKQNRHPLKISVVYDNVFTLARNVLRGVNNDHIYVHRLLDGMMMHLIEDEQGIRCMSVSELGTLLFGCTDSNLYNFDCDNGTVQKLSIRTENGAPTVMLIHRNKLIIVTNKGYIEAWMDLGVMCQ